MSLRRPLAFGRIVAEVVIDSREVLLVEKLENFKARFWTCSRTPEGRAVFASARRTSSIPRHLLGPVWRTIRAIDAEYQQSSDQGSAAA